ncbi:MAG: hypothetical protein JWM68_466 [Verrucomicrobiales bacterium]|nr:hypothetical protein [Verrucomicrobiales bacterium]
MPLKLLSAVFVLLTLGAFAKEPLKVQEDSPVFRELRYEGKINEDEARFIVNAVIESSSKTATSVRFLEGELAVLPPKLPNGLQMERRGNEYWLAVSRPGKFPIQVEVIAKISRSETWNQISFAGPTTPIASVTAQANGSGLELQLLSGTVVASTQTNGVSEVKGFLGADRTVSFRWQNKKVEVTRKVLVTTETTATAQVTPTAVKFNTQFQFDIVQGKLPRLSIVLPQGHALTRLIGEQVRDWQVKTEEGKQTLEIEYIRPIEKSYQLTLVSEQTVESTPSSLALSLPQPLNVERESGALTINAEDTQVEIESAVGLRQVNAANGSLAAYRFNARPFSIALKLKRIEPVISVADRVATRVEETRLLVSHTLVLMVEKAGVYTLELTPQAGLVVADVRSEGLEDWQVSGGKLRLNFTARVLGARLITVQLEQPFKTFPEQIVVMPLRLTGATKETAHIGVATIAGVRAKTIEVGNVREVPINTIGSQTDESLAYTADAADWKLSLAAEKLSARVVAEIFNLVTVGDGLLGGSATIRYGLVNQGVQEFKVKVPSSWKNVEFTGPSIRRKESVVNTNSVVWTIGLQDKVWGGYTLVVTYDIQFDPKNAILHLGGIHALDVERENGSVAVTSAASLKLNVKTAADPLRRIDESELNASDHALITRSVLLAYRYTGNDYDFAVDVNRFEQVTVLDAVTDRTQLTTVLTEAGEMLTQASFMVKNNDKQFQRFQLPDRATFWSCYVNGQSAKPERDGEWLLVSLPRGENRDEAFAVDIVYAEQKPLLKSLMPQAIHLTAPKTDVPNTYAEWEFYAPNAYRLSGFGGNMTVARGTTYDLRDAWQEFVDFYHHILREMGIAIVVVGGFAVLLIALIGSAIRRGWSGVVAVLGLFAIVITLAGMLLPALSKAKSRAQRINSVSSLKQIGTGMRMFANDNGDKLPASFEEMSEQLSSEKIVIDPESGQRFVYVGGAASLDQLKPESVVAYSPTDSGHGRNVLYADGSVSQVSSETFADLSHRGFTLLATQSEMAAQKQSLAVERQQSSFYAEPAKVPQQTATATGDMAMDGIKTANRSVNGLVSGGGMATFTTTATNASYGWSTVGSMAAPMSSPTPTVAAPQPMAAGIRSIRIDIPRAGRAFTFTKVLNVLDEPLAIKTEIMRLSVYQMAQMVVQLCAFVAGLLLFWRQWRRGRRSSLLITIALVLAFGSVGSLLIAWRLLHIGLIILVPALLLSGIAYLAWKYWPRKVPLMVPPTIDSSAGPIVALLALTFFVANANAVSPVVAETKPVAVGTYSILSANYIAQVNDRVAQVDATLQISAKASEQKILLFGEEVVVEKFAAKPGEVRLVRDGKTISAVVAKRGETTLQLRLLVKLSGDITKRELIFGVPPSLASQLTVNIDQLDADVEFPSAISFKKTNQLQQTRVEALLGANEKVELRWTPKVKRAADIAATVFCQNANVVTIGGGVVNTRTTFDYQVTQGELRQMKIRLAVGQRLLRVEGENIRTWEMAKEGEPILTVELAKGVSPGYKLVVETEKVLDTPPSTAKIEVPHALDVKRETGLLALRNTDELSLSVEGVQEIQRVDAEEFTRMTSQKSENLFSVFRFFKTDFDLRIRAEMVQAKVEAVARNSFRVATHDTYLAAYIDYTIKRAGVFGLRVALPEGYRVQQVLGNDVLQHIERTEEGKRILEITFKERKMGTYALHLELVQTYKDLGAAISLSGVQPIGTEKLSGFVEVSSEAGISLKTAGFEKMVEIPATALPANMNRSGAVLAYKLVSVENDSTWKLSLTTEKIEPWIRAQVMNTLTMNEVLVSGRALVRYDIQNAPVKELQLKIPASLKNVEITGANIRRRDQVGELWKIELQNKVSGTHELTVTWEVPRGNKTNLFEVAAVNAAGVERESGFISVVATAPQQVTEHASTDVVKMDRHELPDWAQSTETAALVYRYLRPGYKLVLEAKRFEEAEVLQALVESAKLSTVVADDGQTMTEMSLAVRNNGRQYLEVELPAGAKIWSAFVAGQPVRPSMRASKLLIPIEQSAGTDAAISVVLNYVNTNPFPKTRGSIALVSPKLDTPLKNARWDLFLPPDYEYDNFKGTMTREGSVVIAEVASFSSFEYVKQEKQARSNLRADAKNDVQNVKRKLAEGNYHEAAGDFKKAQAKVAGGNFEDKELKDLERDLRRAQGSNLIAAQNDFVNNGSLANSLSSMEKEKLNLGIQYDAEVAQLQCVRVQDAQEIATPKLQPLHINLPTRGVQRSFTQVLQTEVNKPMTVEFSALNLKTTNWPLRLGGCFVGFLALWGFVAVTTRRTDKTSNAKIA